MCAMDPYTVIVEDGLSAGKSRVKRRDALGPRAANGFCGPCLSAILTCCPDYLCTAVFVKSMLMCNTSRGQRPVLCQGPFPSVLEPVGAFVINPVQTAAGKSV